MAATDDQLAELRRMCGGLAADDATYDDTLLGTYIERYPVMDSSGYDPDDDDWTETYDLHRAAADVCEELAASVVARYDFEADGGKYTVSQLFDHYTRLATRHRAHRKATSVKVQPSKPYVLQHEVADYNEDQLNTVGDVGEGVRTEDIG